MGIFHAYDVRGIYGSQITVEVATKMGHAYARYLQGNSTQEKKVVIGHDARIGAEECANAFIDALLENSIDVIFIGFVTTPMTYFAVNHFDADGGVMVTASHNPAKYLGFKFTREKAIPIAKNTGIEEIKAYFDKDERPDSPAKRGECSPTYLQKDYLKYILGYASDVRDTKMVIDCSNGSACAILPQIVPNLEGEVTLLNHEPDGSFPNHEPNPLDLDACKQLSEAVVKTGAQLGAIFDGDADRIAFVNERGEFISPDLIGTILSIRMVDIAKQANMNPLILYDLRSSKILPQEVHTNGGKSNMTMVGHSFIKKQMREEDAFFASELSGHYYYKSFFYVDNAVITLFELLSFMANHDKPLSQIVDEYSTYAKIHETNFTVDDAQAALRLLKANYPTAKIEELDGVSIIFDDWWCNVRSSNTEPLLRLNLEADTVKLMEEKKAEVIGILTRPEPAN